MSHVLWLNKELGFPPIEQALDEPQGLLAAGGDLSPERLLLAYGQGIFPWYEEGQPILWWSPSPRWILSPEQFHLSRSLRKIIRQEHFQVTMDRAFSQVIRACAQPRAGSLGTWITEDMMNAYQKLHELGFAHSVEVWSRGEEAELLGGLYGVSLGDAFFGESMFSRADNTSKIAMAFLCKQLDVWNFGLIDCQMHTQHLQSLGAAEVEQQRFKELLNTFTQRERTPRPWQLTVEASNFS